MVLRFVIFIMTALPSSALVAQQYRIYGAVRDASTGEALPGASIVVEGRGGAASNAYGYYSLSLPRGEYRIRWSYIGYASETRAIALTGDQPADIRLRPEATGLSEVAVTAERSRPAPAPGVDAKRMSIAEIRRMPAFFAEPDVLRSLQTLPGVQVSHQGSVNMSVRGGSYSQNLVLLDEAPVFNPSHILGFMSSFNPDAVSTVNLYKGVPARYGNMLSSVVDVRMKEGSRDRFGAAGGIGMVASRLAAEGPAFGGKGSYMLAGRYCYAGSSYRAVAGLNDLVEFDSHTRLNPHTVVWFYDLNAKANYTVNERNRIFLSGYNGFDRFFLPDFSGEYLLEWGNLNGTLRWNHIAGPSLFINTSLVASRFGYSYYRMNDGLNYRWDALMRQTELKSDAEHTVSDRLKLRYGLSVSLYGFHPGDISPRDANSPAKAFSLDRGRSLETGLYAEAEWELLPRLLASGGLRLSTFSNIGPGTEYLFDPDARLPLDSTMYGKGRFMQNFANLNPRAGVSYSFGTGHTVKASYASMVQYLHKASSSTLGMPTDIWFPANNNAPPQLAHQFALGYGFSWGKGYTVSIEPYYRKMQRQIDFRDNADLFANPWLDSEICSGDGQSKGLELMLEKMQGRLTGRLSYTLSKTTFTIAGVNDGREYSAPYDARHNLSAFAAFRLNDHWTFSTVFKYTTGRPATVPVGAFNYQGAVFMTYTERNGYRIEDFHQWDINASWTPKPNKKRYRGSWNFSVMNVYNRKNVFSIMIKPDEYSMTMYSVKKMFLYGIFPTVGYEFKF
jgi:hypothetical protein